MPDRPNAFPSSPTDPWVLELLAGFRDAPAVVAAFDQEDILRWANRTYERCFLGGPQRRLSFADVLRHGARRGIGVKIDCGDVELFLQRILPRRRSEPYRAFEVDLVDGEWLWMTETLLPSGWLICIGSVITPLKHNERTLRQARDQALIAAQTDALTCAPNRRSVMEAGPSLLERCRRARLPFTVAAIDLDHFKRANDELGHSGGDEVLRQFAAHCMRELRPGDMLGRLGGEEFLALLPETGEQEAEQLVATLRARLPCAELNERALGWAYTFSAGVAQARAHESWAELLKRADRALYLAKSRGRDRTELDRT